MEYFILSKVQYLFNYCSLCRHVCFSGLAGKFVLSKKQTFQKRCFKWIFEWKVAYEKQLIKYHHLPVSLPAAMQTLFLLLDTLENKYIFDRYNYIVFEPTKTISRRIVTNPLKLIAIPHLQNFMKAVSSFNYLYRDGIINFNDPTNESNIKKFLFAKPFDMELRCS